MLVEFPEDPCGRLIDVAGALAERRRWFQDWSALRCASLGLLVVPGESRDIAERLFSDAESLSRMGRWGSQLRGSVRYCVAAMLITRGLSPGEFHDELAIYRRHFREQKLPKHEVYETLASLVLLGSGAHSRSAAQVERLAEIFRAMKAAEKSWFGSLTGTDDYAATALLSETEDAIETIVARLDRLYTGLRSVRFSRGNRLQLASHLLYFAPDPDEVVIDRFQRLYDGFTRRGLRMHSGDYDEVAILASLSNDPQDSIDRVLEDRNRLRADLRPRPSLQVGFELASSTAFLSMVPASMGDASSSLMGWQLSQVVALVQAQQAAMMAATSGAAAAAAAS